MQKLYIWQANQSEPGCTGRRYEVTKDTQAPAPVEPVAAYPGLTYAESLYDEWKCVGHVHGEHFANACGETIIETSHGAVMPLDQVGHHLSRRA